MNKYKIEITKTYVIDVLADDNQSATEQAEAKLDDAMLKGSEHYYQTGDTIFETFDVTNTDDHFNPQ